MSNSVDLSSINPLRITELMQVLSKARFSLENEKKLQLEIEQKIVQLNIDYQKEYRLGKGSVPDFFIVTEGIVIEIKIKGSASKIYAQLSRYASFECVHHIILVTNRTMGLPAKINNKPTYMIKLGKAWL